MASIGAGGVIYLTPLLFNQIDFTASQIGIGIAFSAFIGLLARLISGRLIDKGFSYTQLIYISAAIAILADISLFNANSFENFLKGQLFLGISTGLYWPAVEVAVPISCGKFPSIKGFSIARTADALGISIGSIFGTFCAAIGEIRYIYIFDIFCLLCLLSLISIKLNSLEQSSLKEEISGRIRNRSNNNDPSKTSIKWIYKLIPILLISILATSIITLCQSSLPLDLAKGGVYRPQLNDTLISALISCQLGILVLIQWPIGKLLCNLEIRHCIRISLLLFCIGCLILAVSTFLQIGVYFVCIGQLLLAFATATFLPSATEVINRFCPKEKRGIGMALFSLCFALSSIIAPPLAGFLLDTQGNGLSLWTIMSCTCLGALVLVKWSKQRLKGNNILYI